MRLYALLLIFVIAFTSGVVCALACPQDMFESHESDCTQCISADFVVSEKTADDPGIIPHTFFTWIDLANLLGLQETVDTPDTLATPRFHHTPILALRV